MKVLILGANGMLGNAMIRIFSERSDWQVYGAIRSQQDINHFESQIAARLYTGVDAERHDSITMLLLELRPDVVINCIGLVKQKNSAKDPLSAISINSIFPHWLTKVCGAYGARVIHFSTDCVFSGKRGMYKETDLADATDLYGRSKLLGEIDYANAITLRSSIIGHELHSRHGLIEWFLSQNGTCKGFTRAIFSGFPTVVMASLVRDTIVPNSNLSGVYHVSSRPISKYDLLCLIREQYGKEIVIIPDDSVVIDRSLNSERFYDATGYIATEWSEMISLMHKYGKSAQSVATQ